MWWDGSQFTEDQTRAAIWFDQEAAEDAAKHARDHDKEGARYGCHLQERQAGFDDIKGIEVAEFVRLGFLQEANRQFFHPRGLALSAVVDDGQSWLGKVWDYRDDPEGIVFADLTGDECRQKAEHVAAEMRKHAAERRIRYGQEIQPIGSTVSEDREATGWNGQRWSESRNLGEVTPEDAQRMRAALTKIAAEIPTTVGSIDRRAMRWMAKVASWGLDPANNIDPGDSY